MSDYSEHGALPVEDGLTTEELEEAWREAQQNPNLADEEQAAKAQRQRNHDGADERSEAQEPE